MSRIAGLVIVVLAAALAGAVGFLVVGGDDGGGQGSSTTDVGDGMPPGDSGAEEPEGMVDALAAAAADRDCERLVDLFTDSILGDDTREETVAYCEDEPEIFDTFADLEPSGPAEVDGASAVVPVEQAEDAEPAVAAVELVQQDGAWLIDRFAYEGRPPPEGIGARETEVEAVVTEYIAASAAGDCEAAFDLYSEDAFEGTTPEVAIAACERNPNRDIWQSAVVLEGSVVVDGAAATAIVTLAGGNVLELSLAREGGVWWLTDVQPT